MFDKVDIVENMILGKVDNDVDNADIVDINTADELALEDDGFEDIANNDTAYKLSVEDDGFEDIVNNYTADELALDDFDDVKKMFDKDDIIENNYLILDKIDIVEKLLLDKDFDIVETD